MKKIKLGKLNTKELVNIFGTTNIKNRIKKGGFLGGNDKESILNRARKFCEIEDLGQGKFNITKIHNLNKIDTDELLSPLLKGLSQYLTPLILIKLLTEQDENYKIILPFLGWAKRFEIINDNYPLLKYHQEKSSKYLQINEDTMFDFFEKMDDSIKYFLEKILKILGNKSGLDLIEVDSITMVRKMIRNQIDVNDEIKFDCGYIDEIISDEDRKFVIDCENIAKEEAGITRNKEKFYGYKSYVYKNKLKKLLKKRKILFTYSAYNIFCKNKKEIKNILSKFESSIDYKDENYIKTINNIFIEYAEDKAKKVSKRESNKREKALNNYDTNPEEISYIKNFRLAEAYINDFKTLSSLTIPKDVKSLKDEIKITLEDIANEFNISIKKN